VASDKPRSIFRACHVTLLFKKMPSFLPPLASSFERYFMHSPAATHMHPSHENPHQLPQKTEKERKGEAKSTA
jgi:hypothetical protein